MSCRFNFNYILRLEFFGGLLVSYESFDVYTISFGDFVFLDCIKKAIPTNKAIEVAKKVSSKEYYPDLELMFEIGVLKEKKEALLANSNSVYELAKLYENKIAHVTKKNYLTAPIEVSIYPSSACQLNCSFCYFKEKRKYYRRTVPVEKWKKVINELKSNNVIYLSILGGEPTLYSDIDIILDHVNNVGIKTTITTNGVGIKKSTFDLICNSDYITPAVSLQSLNETNFNLMGIDYKKIVKTIDRFLKKGKVLRVNTVFSLQTIDEIYQMIDFCVNRGIRDYYINSYMPVDGGNLCNHEFSDYKELSRLINNYLFDNNYQGLIRVDVQGCLLYSAYYNELDNPVTNEYEKLIYGCEAGNTKFEIMPNGDVLPCTAFGLNDFKYENIFDSSLIEVWENAEYLQTIRNYRVKDKKCHKCKFSDFCNGGCPAYNLYKNKNIIEVGDDRCQVNI